MKTITFFIILFLLSSCFYKGRYIISLQEVESPKNLALKSDSTNLSSLVEDEILFLNYEDSLFQVTWVPGNKVFLLNFENKTNSTIRIPWDDAVYVDENGISKRLTFGESKKIDMRNSQLPSIIARGTILNEAIMPVGNVVFNGYFWQVIPFLKDTANDPEELYQLKEKYVGKTVSILLPLQIEDNKYEYIFNFKIEDFIFEDPKKKPKSKEKKDFSDPIYG